jgi:hypothetical protein
MRTLKTLWRLAVDKGLGPKTRRKDAPQRQPEPTPGTPLDTARLLDDEPPTRTLQ